MTLGGEIWRIVLKVYYAGADAPPNSPTDRLQILTFREEGNQRSILRF